MERLAILGCGTMGELLGEGLVRRGGYRPADIMITDRRPARVDEMQASHGFTPAPSNRGAAEEADVLVIAVKPADVPEVLTEIAQTVTRRHLVISVAAGITTSTIEAGLPMAGPIVRAMPNLAARVGEAMTAIAGGDRTGQPDMEKAEQLFSSVGRVVRLPEHLMDAVTALSGSGPGLFALFAETMVRAGTELGLDERTAKDLIAQTMLGTARLLGEGGFSPGQLKQAVASPGGTTEAALESLERNRVAQELIVAVRAAAERASQLSK